MLNLKLVSVLVIMLALSAHIVDKLQVNLTKEDDQSFESTQFRIYCSYMGSYHCRHLCNLDSLSFVIPPL